MEIPIVLIVFAQAEAAAVSHFPTAAVIVLLLGFIAAASVGSLAWFKSQGQFWWRSSREAEGVDATDGPQYDRGIVPAENAARQQRQGMSYKKIPEPKRGDANTAEGFTVDREGLLNNYGVETEPYINEPGDLSNKG